MPEVILGIESSCDESSAALVENGSTVLGEATAHQEEVHRRWGGIVPELASRKHTESLLPVVKLCLERAQLTYPDIHAIAITTRPGLMGSLMVGLSAAKALAYSLNIPLIPVHHLEAHLAAICLQPNESPSFPALGLIVSGGHTSLYEVGRHFLQWKLIGHTRDDAAGEAFDKGARILGLPYPGGPEISKLAVHGNPRAIAFPRALPQKNTLDFSFSGLKTALLHFVQKKPQADKADICASYQEAIVDALVSKTILAAKKYKFQSVIVAGGVAANGRLRKKLKSALPSDALLHVPPPHYCTDNGSMVAAMGSILYRNQLYHEGQSIFSIKPQPRTECKGLLS